MPDSPVLENVYSLIQEGRLAEARQALSEVAADEQNNPDYWWLLVHASEDPEQGKSALRRVMVLDPGYPGANQLYDQIILDKTAKKPRTRSPRRLLPLVAVVLIVVALGVAALALLNRGGIVPAGTPTIVADSTTNDGNAEATDAELIEETAASEVTEAALPPIVTATEPATAEPELTETEAEASTFTPELIATNTATVSSPTAASTSEPTQPAVIGASTSEPTQPAVIGASTSEPTPTQEEFVAQNVAGDLTFLSSFRTPDNAVAVMGDAVEISLCAIPGIEAGNAISSLLIAMSGSVGTVDPLVSAVRVAIVDCDGTGFDTRTVQVSRSILADFAAGAIGLQEMQQNIEPIR
jgi:hypothetical protein